MGTLAAGIKEIFATAKDSGSNVMLCGNDGTPDGHMTMANLASVLDALPGGIYYDTPFNIDTFYNGMVTLNKENSQNITGVCPQTDMRGSLYSQCSLESGVHFGSQTFVSITNTVYKRYIWSGDWGAWQRIDNFGCNTLGALASAVGGLTACGVSPVFTDFTFGVPGNPIYKTTLFTGRKAAIIWLMDMPSGNNGLAIVGHNKVVDLEGSCAAANCTIARESAAGDVTVAHQGHAQVLFRLFIFNY